LSQIFQQSTARLLATQLLQLRLLFRMCIEMSTHLHQQASGGQQRAAAATESTSITIAFFENTGRNETA
jgi:hypothetical protein